jgi:hypothetical protein
VLVPITGGDNWRLSAVAEASGRARFGGKASDEEENVRKTLLQIHAKKSVAGVEEGHEIMAKA